MKKNPTWKSAFFKSPGPDTWSEALSLFLKGLVMGMADIIPGVSGGTIAFITGIYEKLIQAVKSINLNALKNIARLDLKQAVSVLHLRFLLSLGSGIVISIICFAGVMNHLLNKYPVFTWSFFFGLILASVFVIGNRINFSTKQGLSGIICGIVSGFFLVGVIPVDTPENSWFIILSGMIAICAMILPGLSGSFILLILGKYEFITGALKNPFVPDNAFVILLFITGCVFGIVGFSRILSFWFANYYNLTLAFLTGLIIGSLRKIWPWKQVVESKIIQGKLMIIKENNILPCFDNDFLVSLAIMISGVVLVALLAMLGKKAGR